MRTFINYILIIILSITILVFFFANLFSTTILNEEYLLAKLEEQNYYEKVYDEIELNFENYIYQSGLEKDVFKDIITKEKIKNDIKIIINNIYSNNKQEIDTSEIESNLQKNIDNYLEKSGISDFQSESINLFISQICKEYKTAISVINIQLNINQINTYINLIKRTCLIAICISIILLLALDFKFLKKANVGVGLSMLISGMVLIFIRFYVTSKINIGLITFLNDATTIIIRSITNEILNLIMTFGITMFLAGILLIIIFNYIKINQGKRSK